MLTAKPNVSVFFALLLTLVFNVPQKVFSQPAACDSLNARHYGDKTLFLTDPDTLFVRVKPDRYGNDLSTKDLNCLVVEKAGFYRLRAQIEYSEGQANESFYITIHNQFPPQSPFAVCDANAGPYKVVPDLSAGPLRRLAVADTIRDVGIFYFEAGIDTLRINHYFKIQDRYPDFLDSSGVFIQPDDIESVHFSKFEFTYISKNLQRYDLQLDESPTHDSLEIDQSLTYRISIQNHGPGRAFAIAVADTFPDSFQITDAHPAPDSIAGKNVLFWKMDSLDALETRDFIVNGTFDSTRVPPFEVTNTAFVTSLCDTNLSNNRDSSRVKVLPKRFSNVRLWQQVRTDSFRVSQGDTTFLASPGESIRYRIEIQNTSAVPAEHVIVTATRPEFTAFADSPLDSLTWLIPELSPLTDTTLSYFAIADTGLAPGTYQLANRARVVADNEAAGNLLDNTDADTVLLVVPEKQPVILPDLMLTMRVQTDSFEVQNADTVWYAVSGDTLLYTFTIENLQDAVAKNTSMTVHFSELLFGGQASADEVTLDLGAFRPLADTSFTWQAVVRPDLPVGENRIESRAEVFAENEDGRKLQNNRDSTVVLNSTTEPIFLTDLAIWQTTRSDSFLVQDADTVWYVRPGETYAYALHISNRENVRALQVGVKDILPDSVEAVGHAGADTLTWFFAALSPLKDTTLTFQARVANNMNTVPMALVNTAIVSAANEDPNKLSDNITVQNENVFLLPAERFRESCDFFTLDKNVLRPGRGEVLHISFELSNPGTVKLDIYDLNGYHIRTLTEQSFPKGRYQLPWDATTESGMRVGSGVYVITLRSATITCWKKVIIAR